MTPQSSVFGQVKKLEGKWRGGGVAELPTTAIIPYREALTFQAIPGQARLFFTQVTQKREQGDQWVESHWESGFLRVLPDGALEWVDAQNGGRVEVLRGELRENPEGFTLEFASVFVGNDERMGETARRFVFDGGLAYTMHMTRTDMPTLTQHLSATLKRAQWY